jgi:hypothetical protein
MSVNAVLNGAAWAEAVGCCAMLGSLLTCGGLSRALAIAATIILSATLGALLTHRPTR